MRRILYLYWIIYEYAHYRVVRKSNTLRGYIHKCFELYRTRPEWYERARNLHSAQRNEIKGNKTKITKVNKLRANKNSKNPTEKAWDEKEK